MKERITKLLSNKKTSKVILIVGVVLIALILVFGANKGEEAPVQSAEFSEAEYCSMVEENIKNTVYGICMDASPVVMVTLDSSVVYEYANETKQKGAEEQNKSSEESEKTYIIVKDKSGAETPLIITKHMPKVRGVSIICTANETDAEKIKNAVSAALDIPSRKIYIGRKTLQ